MGWIGVGSREVFATEAGLELGVEGSVADKIDCLVPLMVGEGGGGAGGGGVEPAEGVRGGEGVEASVIRRRGAIKGVLEAEFGDGAGDGLLEFGSVDSGISSKEWGIEGGEIEEVVGERECGLFEVLG